MSVFWYTRGKNPEISEEIAKRKKHRISKKRYCKIPETWKTAEES